MAEYRRVYLDHSATTPLDPRVLEAMMPYFMEHYGNPSSVHHFGRAAEHAVETARETIARILNCAPDEIVYTSGGSESDNLAIRGTAWAKRVDSGRTRLVTSPLEHSAVGATVAQLHQVMGFEAVVVPVDQTGVIDHAAYSEACPNASLVSVMLANNEVGTLQDVSMLARTAHTHGALFHTDAVQAAGQVGLDVQALGVDLISLSAHKFYGPKGVGVLYVRRGTTLLASQTGGGHEHGLRAGTHNVAYIVGMARALELAYDEYEVHVAHYLKMRDQLIERVLDAVPGVQLTGHPSQRLASHASFIIAGVETNALLTHLDVRGVAASGASACKSGSPEPSTVLLSLRYSREEASGSLRMTVGRQTTEADLGYAVEALRESVSALRQMDLLGTKLS